MSAFLFIAITEDEETTFWGLFPGGRFQFPGATWDAQVDAGLEFANHIASGVGDAVDWISANLAALNTGEAGWAEGVFDAFFAGTDEVIVAGTVAFDLEAAIEAGDVANVASLGEAIEADEGSVIADAIIDAFAAAAL